ncbi:MAG: hypothetical protein L0206_01015 [Actinobacteria bacterium]|nr:hypothetical protein [Actinomycetota bacterium]
MKLLLIGQAPSATSNPGSPLAGLSGARLARLSGVRLEELLERVEARNLLAAYPGKGGGRKGDAFPAGAARAEAARVDLVGRRAIFLGKNVARAFGVSAAHPFFAWHDHRGARCAVFPHPSGTSRFWNLPANTKRASEFLAAALADLEVPAPKAGPGRPDDEVEAELRRRKKVRFLEAFRQLGNRTYAAMHADTTPKVVRSWEAEDPEFALAVSEAGLEACDRIEQEAYRRAVVGVAKPVIHQGKLCYRTDEQGNVLRDQAGKAILLEQTEWSDELLKLLLRGAKPEKYARQAFEFSGPGGGPIPVVQQVHVVLPANGREVPRTPLRAIEGGKA